MNSLKYTRENAETVRYDIMTNSNVFVLFWKYATNIEPVPASKHCNYYYSINLAMLTLDQFDFVSVSTDSTVL